MQFKGEYRKIANKNLLKISMILGTNDSVFFLLLIQNETYMSLTLLKNQLAIAIFSMATDKSNIKLRLKHAYKNCKFLFDQYIDTEQEISDWKGIKLSLKSYGPVVDAHGNELISSVENTVDYLTEDECVRIAERLIEIYKSISTSVNH